MGALIRVRQRQRQLSLLLMYEELIVRRNLQMMIEQSQIALHA